MRTFHGARQGRVYSLAAIIGSSLLGLSGCSGGAISPTPAADVAATSTESTSTGTASATSTAPASAATTDLDTTGEAESEGHGHKPGAHGGIIVSIGADSYHAEAVFQQGGVLKLFMLGQDESRIVEVDAQNLTAYFRAVDDTEAIPAELKPTPQEGDAVGQTSQFTAQVPVDLVGEALEVTVPNIRIAGERFRLGFTSKPAGHDAADAGMPTAVSGAEERTLYLTPAGKYTQADIDANGGVTASVRFKGVASAHDLHPKAGDRICPVTLTKANPDFPWVINGQTYLFCCPPCVDEYVKMAKERPDELQPADSFVKQ